MSILLLDGFDDDLTAAGYRWADTPTVSSSYGKHGSGAKLGDVPGKKLTFSKDSIYSLYTVGFWIKIVDDDGGGTFLYHGSTNHTLSFDNNANRLYWYSRGTSFIDYQYIYSDTNSFFPNRWHFVELAYKWNTANAGVLGFWIDGEEIYYSTTVDYNNNYGVGSYIDIGYNVDEFYVDDVYVTDGNTPNPLNLGPIEVVTLLPNGNGNSSTMTGSDGNSTDNYLLVDDNPVVTTDYVGGSTEGNKDTYAFENLTNSPTVIGVAVSTVDQKSDTGTKFMRHVVRSGSTDYVGPSFSPSESWAYHETVWDQDPNTSATWTSSNVDSAEFGQEVRDS